jgi:mRNA interferase MazF
MASTDELWLVDFGDPYPGEPAARRPALVLGPPPTSPPFRFVILAPLTTTRRQLNLHIEIEANSENGLSRTSYIACELFRSVSTRRLLHRLGVIDPATSRRVEQVVRSLLGY